MAKTNKIVYVTQEQYNALVTNGSVVVGGVTYTYDANNTYFVREDGGGGGGSGDVTASGTLASNSVILGNGTKSVKASSGTNYKFLTWFNGATWKGLYQHTIHLYDSSSVDYGPVNIYFSFISTSATPITYASDAPIGIFPATGVYDSSSTYCWTVYIDTDNAEVGYVDPTTGYINTMLLDSFADITVTDTVTQIL